MRVAAAEMDVSSSCWSAASPSVEDRSGGGQMARQCSNEVANERFTALRHALPKAADSQHASSPARDSLQLHLLKGRRLRGIMLHIIATSHPSCRPSRCRKAKSVANIHFTCGCGRVEPYRTSSFCLDVSAAAGVSRDGIPPRYNGAPGVLTTNGLASPLARTMLAVCMFVSPRCTS